jgi:hypothetical protein
MERNVTSFNAAIGKGHEPRLYTYDTEQIPLGEFDAVLDFKTWSKRIIAINCYFTKMDTRNKFIVTVYCNNKTGRYQVNDSEVNFSDCATGKAYHIVVAKDAKNRIKLLKAEITAL